MTPSSISEKPRKPKSRQNEDRKFYIGLAAFTLGFGAITATALAIIYDSRWPL